jgi:phosphatidylglycerol:prolipoprotein diacylglycerol transferase
MQIPLNQVRSMDDVTKEMINHAEVIKHTTFISVHPTFLYESMWCIVVFAILMLLRNRTKFDGEQLLRYLFLYALGRFFIEGLRTDQLLLWGTHIPVSKALAGVIVVLSGATYIFVMIRQKKLEKTK